jgi:hypothetical protein
MATRSNPPRYGSYLLRYWEVRSDLPGQPSSWRFSLQKAGADERHAFGDLTALLAYLGEILAGDDVSATSAQEKE